MTNGGTGPTTPEGWVRYLGRTRGDLKPTELHVLLELAALHNRHFHAAHARFGLLSAETHLSERQLHRVVNGLASADREHGPVLHISYGPLPMESRTGHPIYGNVFRFVGFDPIPDNARPRRLLGGRPTLDDNLTSEQMTSDAVPDDTGDPNQMTSEKATQMTSVNSPLYPVADYVRYPGGYPARAREKTPAERGPDEAPPRAASDMDEDPSLAIAAAESVIRDSTTECPICGVRFSGLYAEHSCGPLKRPPPRKVPPKIGNRVNLDELRVAEAELADHARAKKTEQPREIPPEIVAEHERILAQQRAQESQNAEASP